MVPIEVINDLKSVLTELQYEEVKGGTHPLGNSGRVVVYPTSEEEIANVLKYGNEKGKKIVIVGGGTKQGFGGLTETSDIVLSLKNYKGIVEHTVGDMTVTVRPGTTFKELQEYLADHNQKVSLDPMWPENATIGGVIATNDSGPKRLGYGSARDIVIGLKMVYPNGTVIRSGGKVVKNVAGYDMNKLFIGSMGTLGVMSEITLKLRPLPKYESLVLLSFPEANLETVRTYVVKLLDTLMEPISLELLNPTLSKRLTGEKYYTLAISFEDVESSVHYQEEFLKKIQPDKTKITILRTKEAEEFWNRFYTITPNGAIYNDGKETEALLKVGVKNLDVIKVLKECNLLQDTNNLVVEAHGGLGHGLCQVILKGASEDVVSAIAQIREVVSKLRGYVIVKHIPFSLREKVNVWGEKPSYFFLIEGIKSKVDPNRILNHKRFVGGI